MRVTDRLATLFIDESLRDRYMIAEGTSQFLETQLAESRQRLIDSEKRLETFKNNFPASCRRKWSRTSTQFKTTSCTFQPCLTPCTAPARSA